MIPVMILCAGQGTRLRPLTTWRAKPLVPVGDRAVLAHVLESVRAAASRIVVNAHYRAEDVRAFAAIEREREPALIVSEEHEILGTAGGVAHAVDALGPGAILVWNGDILADVDAQALEDAHARGGHEATLVVRDAADGRGNIGLDARGDVVRMRSETTRPGEVRGAEFLGIHVIGAELRGRAPRHGCLVGDLYLPALHAGARIGTVPYVGSFFDIGTIANYLAANEAWLAARGLAAWVADDAEIASGVRVTSGWVGAGATVEGEGEVVGAVVWPGARASAPIGRVVVAREGIATAQ